MYINEDQTFFRAKIKLMHIHSSELANDEFEVFTVIFQLLLAWANCLNTSTFSCYARTLLPCKYSSRHPSLQFGYAWNIKVASFYIDHIKGVYINSQTVECLGIGSLHKVPLCFSTSAH